MVHCDMFRFLRARSVDQLWMSRHSGLGMWIQTSVSSCSSSLLAGAGSVVGTRALSALVGSLCWSGAGSTCMDSVVGPGFMWFILTCTVLQVAEPSESWASSAVLVVIGEGKECGLRLEGGLRSGLVVEEVGRWGFLVLVFICVSSLFFFSGCGCC